MAVLKENRMNTSKKIARVGTVIAFFCALLIIFWSQKKGEGEPSTPQTDPGFGGLYVRPGWLCEGVTNVVHRPAGQQQFRDWAGLEFRIDKAKLYLPDACRVTVQPAIATNPLLADVYHTISNAISAVDTILKDKNCYVHKFGRSVWLVSIDRPRGGIWRITPSVGKNGVSHVLFDKYEDAEFSLLNLAESFELSFKADKSVEDFGTTSATAFLRCRHVARDNQPFDIRWSRRISPTVSKVMMFDADGRLVDEKTVDDRTFPDPFL